MARRSKAARSLGALSAVMKDHLYAVGRGGLIFTSPWIVTAPQTRYYATVLLTARQAPFELDIAGKTRAYRAVALRQMTKRAVRAVNARILSFQLDPAHAHFARFRAIPAPGLLPLPREPFGAFDDRLDAAYGGQLSAAQAAHLHDDVIETALSYLPPAKPLDGRVRRVIALLWADHDHPLDDLAAAVGLSYNRLSHLFAESMGLSLRVYQHWHKVRKAMTLFGMESARRLTDIAHASGFTDSSHMCKAFIRSHGAPPSYFLNRDCVRIVSVGRRPAAPGRGLSAAGCAE